jgi:exodeoxyribonuclease VIII
MATCGEAAGFTAEGREPMAENSIIEDLKNEDYHAHEAISNTNLSWLSDYSPRHLKVWKWEEEPPPATDPQIKGIGIHCLTLESEEVYLSKFAVWTGKQKRGKAFDEFLLEHEGKYIITKTVDEEIRCTREGVFRHPMARKLIEAAKRVECSYFTELHGIKCKARPDLETIHDALVDLKSTQNARPDVFAKSIENYSYDRQAAFQHDVVARTRGQEYLDVNTRPYYWIAVESKSPHEVSVLQAVPDMIHYGRIAYVQLLEVIHNCMILDSWPGYSQRIELAHYPRWSKKGRSV